MGSKEQPLFDLNEPPLKDESDFPLCFKPKAQSLFTTVDDLNSVETTLIPSRTVNSRPFSHASSGSAFQPFIQSKGDHEKVNEFTDRSDCNVTVATNPSRIVGVKGVPHHGEEGEYKPYKCVEDVVTVDVHVARDLLLNAGHRYLDVRTNEEFKKSHVDNALNIPYMFITQEGKVKNPEFLAQVSILCDKQDSYIVACNSGGRSLKASADLLTAGYKNVKNMAGGYSAWVDNGFAQDSAPPEELKIACKFRR